MTKEEKAEKDARDKEHQRIKSIRENGAVDAWLVPLKVGDKVKGLSACYRGCDAAYHAEIVSVEKFVHVPDKTDKDDAYAEQGGTYHFIKIKDIILADTYWLRAENVEKV